jgi:virulence-associated protein VapD
VGLDKAISRGIAAKIVQQAVNVTFLSKDMSISFEELSFITSIGSVYLTEEEFRSQETALQNELLCDWWMNNGLKPPI